MNESINKYQLRYLPIFYEDLYDRTSYILEVLNNKKAAVNLINSVENAIMARVPLAESFEKFKSKKDRKHPYYRIFVGNFIIYYVVIIDDNNNRIMEIRRFLYNKQNRNHIL